MKKSPIFSSAVLLSGMILMACQTQTPGHTTPQNPGGDNRMTICPADQMQGLVGQKATQAGVALGKIPADQRTPTYFVGEKQALPNSVERGSTLVKLDTPQVSSNPDLSAYTIVGVYCFTGEGWVK